MAGSAPRFRYQPFYCEENAWWLARAPELAVLERWIGFISNPERKVAMWAQRAAPPGAPTVWDYHVIVLAGACGGPLQVWDLDHRPGTPVSATDWIAASFPVRLPPTFSPRFRLVPHAEVLQGFASDRRHMRDGIGTWLAPPPPWAPIRASDDGPAHTLERFLTSDGAGPGIVMDLNEFGAWIAGGTPPARS